MSSTQFYRVIYPLLARTATPTAEIQNDYDHERLGGHIVIDVTAVTATPSVVATLEAFDENSGKWYALLTSAAITAIGTTVLRVYPGIAAVANLGISDIVPPTWRLRMTHGDADSITYTAAAFFRD